MSSGVPDPIGPPPSSEPGQQTAPIDATGSPEDLKDLAAQRAENERADHEHLEALPEAIGELVRRLGGQIPPGNWDYRDHRIRIQHRPGAGISAMYRMPAGTGFSELGLSTEFIEPGLPGVASTRIFATHRREGVTVSGWIHPHDPRLPGLHLASNRALVRESWGEGELLIGLRTIAYRPLRRAVLSATFATLGPLRIKRTIYLKVGKPKAIAALRVRHLLLADTTVPVPGLISRRALGTPPSDGSTSSARMGEPEDDAGVLALESGNGVPLSAAIRPHAGADLEPAEFIALLDSLPPSVMALEPKAAWSDSLRRYLQAATLTLPHRADQLADLATRIEEHLAVSDRGPLVPAHGDFYDANILLQNSRISALLDLDSLGPGHRIDDLACLLGHLAVLPTLGEKNAGAVAALERFAEVFQAHVDPRGLWARAGAVALTLIAGSRSLGAQRGEEVAEARLQAVEALLCRADAFTGDKPRQEQSGQAP